MPTHNICQPPGTEASSSCAASSSSSAPPPPAAVVPGEIHEAEEYRKSNMTDLVHSCVCSVRAFWTRTYNMDETYSPGTSTIRTEEFAIPPRVVYSTDHMSVGSCIIYNLERFVFGQRLKTAPASVCCQSV